MSRTAVQQIMVGVISLLLVTVIGGYAFATEYDLFVGEDLPTFQTGTAWGYAPFVWADENGRYVGFDADVIRSIAIIEGFNLEKPLDMDFAGLIPALAAGKYDIFYGGITITEARAKVIDYTDPYLETSYMVITRSDSDLNAVTAMCCGRQVGVHMGTTQHKIVQDLEKSVGCTPAVYDRPILSVNDLLAGRIDSILVDTPYGDQTLKKHPNQLKKAGLLYTGELTGMAVQKGDPKGILPLINDGFKKLKTMGIWQPLLNAYMTGDLSLISDAVTEAGPLLFEDKDPLAYALKLEELMTK